MTSLEVELLSAKDAKEILDFELENREYFESILPKRPDEYYSIENITTILKEIEDEMERDVCYMYIVRNDEGKIVGRVNLFNVARGILQKCELGYRIGKEYIGRGYGTFSVKKVMEQGFDKHRFHRIEASTDPENIGSQIVLIKNGFQFVGRSEKYILVNGLWKDSIHFEKLNPGE